MRRNSSVLAALAILLLIPTPAYAARPSIKSISPTHGVVGTTVNIRGSNFGIRKGTVKFGTVKASIKSWTSRALTVKAPTNFGRVGISVIVGKNISKTMAFRYDVQSVVTGARILAYNDLGMHCVDKDFSIFSILPPFNVVDAQVIGQTKAGVPILLSANDVTVRYDAVADPNGSINSTSIGKSNFWQYVNHIYGANLPEGAGLTGLTMPADASTVANQSLTWNSTYSWFTAFGIPIFPVDDHGTVNRYPLMRISAKDKTSGANLASVDIVLPVSEETTCQTCHNNGGPGARRQGITFVTRTDKEVESRENILLLHDALKGTALYATKPVLCASCHYSPALDLGGTGPSPTQQQHNTISAAMHAFHSDKMIDSNGTAFDDTAVAKGGTPPSADRQACYQCHPGVSTKCLRGAMTQSITCQNCHGGMSAVGGAYPLQTGGSIDGTNDGHSRRPWSDLPRCQSCHTGDANSHLTPNGSLVSNDGFRLLLAFSPSDPSASPRLATSSRFAEEPNKLYRRSHGHGGVSCEGCHGSTHAVWPNYDLNANDNITSTELQGHRGVIMECTTCHRAGTLPANLNGPHGMHPVGDSNWISAHEGQYHQHSSDCLACHGADLRGTSLSVASMDRTLKSGERGTKVFHKGDVIGCYSCHNGPNGD
jgi:hypothetical protein